MTAKEFHLGDILSVIVERNISPRGPEGTLDLLNYMMGEKIPIHQFDQEAMRKCRLGLWKQFPQLRRVKWNADNWRSCLARKIKKHGEYLLVSPILSDYKAKHELKKAL